MINTDYFHRISKALRDSAPAVPGGTASLVLVSCFLFGIQTHLGLTRGVFSAGAAVFLRGHVHRLLVHPFSHGTLAQLVLSAAALLGLGSGLERGVGSVRLVFLFLLMSTTTGLLYSLLDLLRDASLRVPAEGLLPAALACVALTTTRTKMTRGFLCGVSFPTLALPWVFLIVTTALIPNCVLPCNVIGILVGWMYGRGWLSFLDLTETRAGVLEKTMPFRLLRNIRGVKFVPASTEERRKTLLPQINPTPGSYPVQAYAPLSSISTAGEGAVMYEGWSNLTDALSVPARPFGHGSTHSHSCNHNHHGHSHDPL